YAYEKLLAEERGGKPVELTYGTAPTQPTSTDAAARVLDAVVLNEDGTEVTTLINPQMYRIRIRCKALAACGAISVGYIVQLPNGHVLYGVNTRALGHAVEARTGDMVEVTFRLRCLLATGQYLIAAAIARMKGEIDYQVLHVAREAVVISVIADGRFAGDVDFQSTLESVRTSGLEGQAGAVTSRAGDGPR